MRAAAGAVQAEVRKLATLPSLRWVAVLTWAATLLLALVVHRAAPAEEPVRTALRWSQAGFLVFGVLAATQEYESGGQFRATLLAVPQRGRLAAAKGIALPAAGLVLAGPVLSTGAALGPYLIGLVLIGAAAGTLTRSSLTAVLGLLTTYLIACPLLRGHSPALGAWLPDTALLEPSRGAPAAAGWTLAALLAATAALCRRAA